MRVSQVFECGATAFYELYRDVPCCGKVYLQTKGMGMKKAIYYASAAAAIMSASAVAQAEEGWYGRLGVGVIADGSADVDAPFNVAGSMDDKGSAENLKIV